MTHLVLPRRLADEMVDHCRRGRPNEACGILAVDGREVTKVFRMSNASASPVRYSLDPKEQFAIYKELDERGWDLGGVFHSHTHTAPYPSPTDVRLASEDVPYVIVSLRQDPPEMKAYRILKENWTDDQGVVQEVPIEIIDGE